MSRGAVRQAVVGECGDVGAVLADAFIDDPVLSFLFPDGTRRPTLLAAFFANRLAAGHDLDHILVPNTRGVRSAAAVWEPPRQPGDPEPDFGPAVAALRSLLGDDWLVERLIPLGALKEARPSTPHWYLAFIGTRAPERGRGLASELIAQVTDRCDTEGIPAYLESSHPANIPLYERHGFRVIGEVVIPEGPRIPLMWRDPLE
ncbi:MAG: GNAT family N-acetyltransferase [Actinomycetota bacterium]|nr:GNAT family N-acetyltransferase [Actinomycetota bacterium]